MLGEKLKNFIYHKLTDQIVTAISFISFLAIVINCSVTSNTVPNQVYPYTYHESFQYTFNAEIFLIIIPAIETIIKLITNRKTYYINLPFIKFHS